MESCGQIGCDVSFATTFLWRNKYDIKVCRYNDTLYKAYFNKHGVGGYSFPIGDKPPKEMLDVILADAKARGTKPLIGMLNKTNAEILSHLYDGVFEFTEERDSADYIYSRENLALLPGKKFHAKRNHISKFMRNNPDFCYKELDSSNFEDAYFVAHKWQMSSSAGDTSELLAIREALDNFDALELFGGVLYVLFSHQASSRWLRRRQQALQEKTAPMYALPGSALEQLCAGGLMLGAWFMATDYVTSPITGRGQLVFGTLLGILTWLFRLIGTSVEGVSYSIIFCNLLVPMIEHYTRPVAAGVAKQSREAKRLMREKAREARRLKAADRKEKSV